MNARASMTAIIRLIHCRLKARVKSSWPGVAALTCLAAVGALSVAGCGGSVGRSLEDQFDAVMRGDLTALAPPDGAAGATTFDTPEARATLRGELARLQTLIQRETAAARERAPRPLRRDEDRRLRQWAEEYAGAARAMLKNADPYAALLDVWALTRRMNDFIAGEEARVFLGPGQQGAIDATARIQDEVEKLVREYLPPETARVAELRLTEYVHSRPLRRPRTWFGRLIDPLGVGRDLFSAVSGILTLPLAPGQAISSLSRGATEMRRFNVTAARFTNVIQGLPRQTRLELEALLASSDNFTTISQALRDLREGAVAINEAMAEADGLTTDVRDVILTAEQTAGTWTDTARAAGDTADRFTITAAAVKEAAAALSEAADSISASMEKSGIRLGAAGGVNGVAGANGATAVGGATTTLRDTAESITRAAESVKAAAEASRELTRTLREPRMRRGPRVALDAEEPPAPVDEAIANLPFDATEPSPPADDYGAGRPGDLRPRYTRPGNSGPPPPVVDLSQVDNGGFNPNDYTEAARAIEQGAYAVREMLADIRSMQERNEELRQRKRAEGLDPRGFQPLDYKEAADAISGAAANVHGTIAKVEEMVDTGKFQAGAEGMQSTLEPFFVMAVGRAQAITDYIALRVGILIIITFALGMIFVIVQRRLPPDGRIGRKPPPPAIEQ